MSHQPTCCLWEKVKADKTAVLSLCKDGAHGRKAVGLPAPAGQGCVAGGWATLKALPLFRSHIQKAAENKVRRWKYPEQTGSCLHVAFSFVCFVGFSFFFCFCFSWHNKQLLEAKTNLQSAKTKSKHGHVQFPARLLRWAVIAPARRGTWWHCGEERWPFQISWQMARWERLGLLDSRLCEKTLRKRLRDGHDHGPLGSVCPARHQAVCISHQCLCRSRSMCHNPYGPHFKLSSASLPAPRSTIALWRTPR